MENPNPSITGIFILDVGGAALNPRQRRGEFVTQDLQFFDHDALFYRLSDGIADSNKEVVFVVGAPISAPVAGSLGVADVNAVVQLIRSKFLSKPAQIQRLDRELTSSDNPYQKAFEFLSGRAGQDEANAIVKRAVAGALRSSTPAHWPAEITKLSEEQLSNLDGDNKIWHLTPGLDALGALIAAHPDRFGKLLVTSNFDPLVEVAIKRHGYNAWRTSLAVDGTLHQSNADGCQVVHIHGFWHGVDTLHMGRQLLMDRPNLQNSLLSMLHDKIVVVLAYGGWPDIFTTALSGIVSNDNLLPDILWTSYGPEPKLSDYVLGALSRGILRNRVTLYRGIDCHKFLPELLEYWETDQTSLRDGQDEKPSPAVTRHDREKLFRLPPQECDRPPNVDVWVGRENELRALETSKANVVIICGIGGEGKSALTAHYIGNLRTDESNYRIWDWRDCKEQSDRIRTQLVEALVRFSRGRISSNDLAEAEDEEIVDILIDTVKDEGAVIVLDNVDSYVDLENSAFTGMLDVLVSKFSGVSSTSRIMLTCRPTVEYASSSIITLSLKGISPEEAIELFAARGLTDPTLESDIRDAHGLTKGHAFWLDLMATQVKQVPGTTLRKLLEDMRRGREGGPDILSSIWDKLARREQTLLRFMAEAVRPESEAQIQKFSSAELNYKNFQRALKALISFNLIVVKPEDNAPDLYDLHPLVRQFVRTKFAPSERSGFIRVVINQYEIIIGAIEAMLGVNLPFPMLERWSQKAELEISAGLHEQAFETLFKVEDAMIGGGHLQEYVRVARLLFEAIDWQTAPTKFRRFDRLFGVTVSAFDQLGDTASADSLIQRYEETVPQKTARYIHYCDVRGFSEWQRGRFAEAIAWASRGVTLKNETNVDTQFSCDHTLALAERDAGDPRKAMEYFLKGYSIEQLVHEESEVEADGPTYGNVGRCLQMLGEYDQALACYRRSIRVLEGDSTSHSKSNRAYARQWIAEVLERIGEGRTATAFYVDAIQILGASAPVRVRALSNALAHAMGTQAQVMSNSEASSIVNRWYTRK